MNTKQYENLNKLRKELILNEKRKFDIVVNSSLLDNNINFRNIVNTAINEYENSKFDINKSIGGLIESIKQNNS